MVELNIEHIIDQSLIAGMNEEDLEELIQEEIAESLTEEMKKHIDEMSFIDLVFNQESQSFTVTAELILCSKQDIVTNAEIQAQKMAKYGLRQEEILDVLETQLIETGGF